MSDLTTTIDVTTYFTNDTYTPYSIITNLNKILTDLGIKNLPTQMGYNYDKNGLFVKGMKGTKMYTQDQVITWVNKYLEKKLG